MGFGVVLGEKNKGDCLEYAQNFYVYSMIYK